MFFIPFKKAGLFNNETYFLLLSFKYYAYVSIVRLLQVFNYKSVLKVKPKPIKDRIYLAHLFPANFKLRADKSILLKIVFENIKGKIK